MREILRDYGVAIGPTVAFVAAVAMLWIKEGFDQRAARRKAVRRLQRIAEMLRESPPPLFRNPSASANALDAMIQNAVNFSLFYDRIAAVDGALKSADTFVHENGPVELIMRYHRIKQDLTVILREQDFVRRPNPESSPIPNEDNFFNITQAWQSMLLAAADKN